VHVGALLFDKFMNLSLVNILIPFTSPYQPLFVALGIGGFYLLLLVLLTSLYNITTHPKFWRTIHFFGIVMFGLIFLHGILIGTDIKLDWVKALYWLTAIPVFLAVGYRLWWKYRRTINQ
jgi:sulfoxide reductase heme-binding subunit YedZ